VVFIITVAVGAITYISLANH